MISGVLSEDERWRLEKRTYEADVRAQHRQGGGEVVPKETLWIGIILAMLWMLSVMHHLRISCRASNLIQKKWISDT